MGSSRSILTAGEQVQIRREFGSQHAKMTINFDPRVVDGVIAMPGFPEGQSAGGLGLLAWRLVAP